METASEKPQALPNSSDFRTSSSLAESSASFSRSTSKGLPASHGSPPSIRSIRLIHVELTKQEKERPGWGGSSRMGSRLLSSSARSVHSVVKLPKIGNHGGPGRIMGGRGPLYGAPRIWSITQVALAPLAPVLGQLPSPFKSATILWISGCWI